jgi:hypothetical protein
MQRAGPVRVTAAVLGAEESRSVFGVPVYDSGVQPVWLNIENQDRVRYAFFSSSVDQNRFSPLEAAYRNHYRLFFAANDKMNVYFFQNAMGQIIPPGKTVSGFVYTNRDLGAKYAHNELAVGTGAREQSARAVGIRPLPNQRKFSASSFASKS